MVVRMMEMPSPEVFVAYCFSLVMSGVLLGVLLFHRPQRKQQECEHTHTFRFNLPEGTPWYSHGKCKGVHSGGLQIIGCYICSKVWCLDYRA